MKVTKFKYYNRFLTILAHNQHILLVKDSIKGQVGRIDNINICAICHTKVIFYNMLPVRMNNDRSNQIRMMNLNNRQAKQSIKIQSNQFIIVPLENKPIYLAKVSIGRQKNFLYRRLKLIRIIQYELEQWFTIFDVKLNLDSVFMTVVKETRQQNKPVFIEEVNIDGYNSLGNGQRSMKNQNSKKVASKKQKIHLSPYGKLYILTNSLYRINHLFLFKNQEYDHINFTNDSCYLIYVKSYILTIQCKYQKNWRIRGKKKQRLTLQIIYRYNHLLDYN